MPRIRPRTILLPALLILLTASTAAWRSTGSARQATPDLQAERALAARVSEERVVETVRRLVGFGTRMYGTPSNHASAAWLAGAFREAGLEEVVRHDTPASWYQPNAWRVRMLTGARGGEGSVLDTAWPHTGSPPARGEGPLSLEAAPGAVLLTSENPTPESTAGCIAVLYSGRHSSSGWPMVGRLRGEWSIPVFGISTRESEALIARLVGGEAVRIAFSLEASTGEDPGHTVVATLPGRDHTKYVLFCAHGDSDSGGPGADDNASGAAIVLEIARAASEAMRLGTLPTPAWDMRFAVWGGEMNSTGQYLRTMSEDPSVLQAVFNYDQSGFGSWRDALYVEPDDVEANNGLIKLIRGVMGDHMGHTGFPSRAASIKSQGGTDSYVFQRTRDPNAVIYPSVTLYTSAWDRLEPVPVTPGYPPLNWYDDEEAGMVTVDGDAFYHSAGDRPENTTDTEPWNMGWCARVGLLSALRLMGTTGGG